MIITNRALLSTKSQYTAQLELWPAGCRQPVDEEGEGFAAAAPDRDGEEGGPGREPSVEDLPPICSSLTPQDVATCHSKYWACPGANNLKVGASGWERSPMEAWQ